MRKTRWLLLALLVSAIFVVVGGYHVSQQRNRLLAPSKPAKLPAELNSLSRNWTWSHSAKDRPVVEASARDFRQIKDTSRFELGEVELKIFSKDGSSYDLVRSKQAEFNQPDERLYSEGEVTIILGLPASGEPDPNVRYVEIHTSGLTYENKFGTSATDRPVRFVFEGGEGRSVGALYDSANRYLWLKSDAEVTASSGMRIRAGELHYREGEDKVELRPWSSIERGKQGVEAGNATVYLKDGDVRRIEAENGKGYDLSRPDRAVRFAGAWLEVNFAPQQAIETASGIGNAEVTSQSQTGTIKATGGRIDLEFRTPAASGESQLATAFVRENARLESAPASGQETRVLTAEMVKLTMKPGGEDIHELETLSAGRLEFLPGRSEQWKRTLTAERLSAQYLPGNRMETLRAVGKVHLRSDPPAGLPSVPRLTWSDNLEALFDPGTGEMRELRQWSNFRYQEGQRHARSHAARFEAAADRVLLNDGAQVWDGSTLTTADFMLLDQREDRFQAEGKVSSTHHEKQAGEVTGGLFSSEGPIHATAKHLESRQGNQILHYRGGARLWQGGNSIQAEDIIVDRQARKLEARGAVTSVLVEEDDGVITPKGPPRLVTVTAESLEYTDDNRCAHYSGKVTMRRRGMTVRSKELEAYLKPQEESSEGRSKLERALARGRVEIIENPTEPRPARRAYAEQADYLAAEEKVILSGGLPTIEDPGRGFMRGEELTYWVNEDRVLVSGKPGGRALTHQKLKRN